MRIKDIINEAPLKDFEFFGGDDEGSFRRDDIKAATSRKWLRKLKTSFVRTPYNFNVYVYNGTEGKVTLGDITIEPRDLENVHKYAGVIDIEKVAKVIGKLPPDSDVSITALLIENEGAERLPLTPWILAHRVSHAILYASHTTKIGVYAQELNTMFSEFLYAMEKALIADGREMPMGGLTARANQVAKVVATFRSGRTGQLASAGEFMVEMMTQFIVRGEIVFNRLGGGIDTQIAIAERKFNNQIRHILKECVGKAVVL
jgi:hypothetical protein